MSSSIEFLLQKYGMSPKNSQTPNHRSSNSRTELLDLRQSPLRSSDLNSSLEIELHRAKAEIMELKSQLNSTRLQKDKEITLKSMELESELKIQTGRNKNLEDQIAFLKSQIEFFENENKKTHEQYLIEKENWLLQTESLKRQLQYKQIEGTSTSSSVKLEKEENRVLREQLIQMKNTENELLNEINELKKQNDKESLKIKEMIDIREIEHKTNLGDVELTLKQIKIDNEKLQQLCEGLNSSLIDKDRKIKELETVIRLSEDAREALKKQQAATQDFIKDVVSVNEQLVDTLQKVPRNKKKSGSKTSRKKTSPIPKSFKEDENKRKRVVVPSYLSQEVKLQETIQNLEDEISEINNSCMKLIANTNDGSLDYMKHKDEIDKYSKLLDEKSKTLFAAKRRYSSLVREKMISKAIN